METSKQKKNLSKKSSEILAEIFLSFLYDFRMVDDKKITASIISLKLFHFQYRKIINRNAKKNEDKLNGIIYFEASHIRTYQSKSKMPE